MAIRLFTTCCLLKIKSDSYHFIFSCHHQKIMEIQLLSDDGDLSQESNDISAMAEQAQTNLDS